MTKLVQLVGSCVLLGIGTVVQPVVVVPTPESLPVRSVVLLAAFILLALGVAGYLASSTGAGPAEAVAIGPGTLLVILLLGPAVDLLRRTFPAMERSDALT